MGCSEVKNREACFANKATGGEGFHASYRLVRKLGQGSSSSVYAACTKGRKPVEIAVKVFELGTDSCQHDEASKLRVRMEVEVLQKVSDEVHCVQFIDFYEEG